MSSGAPVRMPRLNVDRRAQLIEATIDVIYRDGLSRLTLAKVAQQAGLSTSIVNFYFKTKEQLLLETLNAVSQEYEAAVDRAFARSPDPTSTLRALVDDAVWDAREAVTADLSHYHSGIGRELFANFRAAVTPAEQGASAIGFINASGS